MTTTHDGLFTVGGVIVGQFLALADRPGGANPDGCAGHFDPAVRAAAVVDEPRHVAADRRVTAPPAVDAEDPDASLRQVAFLTRLAVAVAHELAAIIDDPLVLIDRFGGEDAEVVDLRAAADNFRKLQRFRHLHALQSARAAVRNLSEYIGYHSASAHGLHVAHV